MINLLKEKNSSSKIYLAIISIAVVIGTFIRFNGLGTWTLALDEYYIIKSSENILKHGIPQFPNGGYYIRGILLQYMIAPLLSLGVKAELAGRIFTVIANLITIPAVYLIAKKVGNQLIATIVVVIFSFSIWEIEFARFARMYTPFQAIFTWYIYLALVDFKNKNFKNYKWLLLLSAISFLVYEGSIFLAVFNFVPFILQKKINYKFFIIAIITFIASAFVNLFDFRTIFSNPIFPTEFDQIIRATISKPPIKIPKILLLFAYNGVVTSILTTVLLFVNGYLAYSITQLANKKNFWFLFSIIFLTVLAFLNQFGLFLLSFLILVFWNLFEIKNNKKIILFYLSVIFVLNLIYWFGFGLLTDSWYILFHDFSSFSIWGISKRLIVGFFNYPDNYFSIVNFTKTMPLLTMFSTISMVALFIVLFLKKEKFLQIKFLIGVLIFFSLIATIPTLLYEETRYTFFLVPILMLLVVYSIYTISKLYISQKLVSNSFVVICTLLIFGLSIDFNFYHLLNIDKAEVNYRMIYKSNNIKKHLYRRWDIKTPSEYVKQHLEKDDIVIINENSHEYYLPRVDYYNFDYMHEAFVTISVDYGKRERWSDVKLIYTNDDLINFIENRKTTIWFTVFPENYLYDIKFYERYKDFIVYQGIDKMIKVFRFPKKTANLNSYVQ